MVYLRTISVVEVTFMQHKIPHLLNNEL